TSDASQAPSSSGAGSGGGGGSTGPTGGAMRGAGAAGGGGALGPAGGGAGGGGGGVDAGGGAAGGGPRGGWARARGRRRTRGSPRPCQPRLTSTGWAMLGLRGSLMRTWRSRSRGVSGGRCGWGGAPR